MGAFSLIVVINLLNRKMINGLAISGQSASSVRQSTGERKTRPPSSARHRKETLKSSSRQASNGVADLSVTASNSVAHSVDASHDSQLKLNLSILSSRSSASEAKDIVPAQKHSMSDNSEQCWTDNGSQSTSALPLPCVRKL